MGYKNLMNQLQGYEQNVPEYLQQFFNEYSASPHNDVVANEIQRRSADSLGRGLGEIAGYFGNAGRAGSGLMGSTMRDLTAENMQRERSDLAGLLNQDYQAHMGRMMQGAQTVAGLQGAGMQGTAQGYGADQAKRASMYGSDQSRIASMYGSDRSLDAARLAANASRYNTDAYRDIGMGNLGMNTRFGNWDRMYRQDMMPYEQLGMIGQGIGPILGNFGTSTSSGTNQSWGPQMNTGSSMLQGMIGGGLTGGGVGQGFAGGKGGGQSSAPVWGQQQGFAFPMTWTGW